MNRIRQQFTAVLCTGLMMVTPWMITGCVPIATAGVSLSAGLLDPGAFLKVFSSSITAGSVVEVQFTGANGYSVSVDTGLTEDGSANVPVPLLWDAAGNFISGEVTVSVNGIASEQPLTINALPEITGVGNGELLIATLQTSIEDLQQALADLQVTSSQYAQVDNTAAVANLNEQIAAAQNIINQLQTTGQLVLTYEGGQQVTLSANDLHRVDRILAAYQLGALAELRGSSAAKSLHALQSDGATPDAAEPVTKDLPRQLKNVVANQIQGGTKILGYAVVGIIAAGTWWLSGSAMAGAAAGAVVTAVAATVSSVASHAAKSTASAIKNEERPKYDVATELGDIIDGVIPVMLGKPPMPRPMEIIIDGAEKAKDVKEYYDSVKKLKCPQEGNQFTIPSGFCLVQPPPINNTGSNTGGSCSTVAYATYTSSETIRIVTNGVDATLGLLGQTDRMQICEAPTVHVYDSGGSYVGNFTVPWSALNVSLMETPIVFITYQAKNGLFARVEYTTGLPIALETSNQ